MLPAADPQLALKLTAMDDPKRRIILTKAKAASLNGYLVNGFNMNLLEQSKDRKSCLLSDAIYEKLRQAAAHYSSVELGQFEMEVSLKSARLFIFLGDKILGHKGSHMFSLTNPDKNWVWSRQTTLKRLDFQVTLLHSVNGWNCAPLGKTTVLSLNVS